LNRKMTYLRQHPSPGPVVITFVVLEVGNCQVLMWLHLRKSLNCLLHLLSRSRPGGSLFWFLITECYFAIVLVIHFQSWPKFRKPSADRRRFVRCGASANLTNLSTLNLGHDRKSFGRWASSWIKLWSCVMCRYSSAVPCGGTELNHFFLHPCRKGPSRLCSICPLEDISLSILAILPSATYLLPPNLHSLPLSADVLELSPAHGRTHILNHTYLTLFTVSKEMEASIGKLNNRQLPLVAISLPHSRGKTAPHCPSLYSSIHQTPPIRSNFSFQDRGTIKRRVLYLCAEI